MREIYGSAIPARCIEDCEDGLLYAQETVAIACIPFVFRCYCSRGIRHKHYSAWHPVLSKKTYTKYVFKEDHELLAKYFPARSLGAVSTTPSPGSETKQEDIPEALIKHFVDGEFISSDWELHRETYGRDRLAQWYKTWKTK